MRYVDGVADSAHFSLQQLYAYLDDLGIEHTTVEHEPLFTVADAKRLRGGLPGGHSKSLFLKNKKGRMWLVVADEDQEVDLAVLAESLESKRLSFGSPERLLRALGVTPGAVTPFAVINDGANLVTAVVTQRLLDQDPLNFHPLVNDRTTTISSADLRRFLAATGHDPIVLDDDALC